MQGIRIIKSMEGKSAINLPSPECLMVKELVEGELKNIKGIVDFSFYETLT